MTFNNTNLNPGLFIIESCRASDITNDLRDGYRLKNYLEMTKDSHPIKYRFVFDQNDLHDAIKEFYESHFKYMHICCHGSDTGVLFGNTTFLSYIQFAKLFAGKLDRRRITFSACELGNDTFIRTFFSCNKTLHSLIASVPATSSYDMLLFWAGFYQKMFLENLNGDNIDISFVDDLVERMSIAVDNKMLVAHYHADKESISVHDFPQPTNSNPRWYKWSNGQFI